MPALSNPPSAKSGVVFPAVSIRAQLSSRRYFAVTFLVCFLFYVFPFFALRYWKNESWLLSYWGHVINTTYQQQHQDADVVIFGDSTAATNIDPMRLSRDLHLKVIVLPNVSTSLPVTGFRPLEQYLRTNKPPELIVFYMSAWNLDFIHNPFMPIVEEGEEMLLWHGSSRDVASYAIGHPRKFFMFPLHFYGDTNRIGDVLYSRVHQVPEVKQGHIMFLSYPFPMRGDCVFDPERLPGGTDASSREAAVRFSRPQTQTMVFVSPVPNCRGIERVTNARHDGLPVLPAQVLPPSNFREDGWQAHMLTGTLEPPTRNLENAIRQKLGAQD